MAFTSSSVMSRSAPGRRRKPPGRCPRAREGRCRIGRTTLSSRPRRQRRRQPRSAWSPSARGGGPARRAVGRGSGYCDNRSRPHVGELLDQMRTDVAGRSDDEMAGVVAEHTGRVRQRVPPLQPRDMADGSPGTRPGPPRRRPAASASTCSAVDHGRHRLVEIDYAAPDFGMLQRERAAQPPQHGMSRVGPDRPGRRAGRCG